MELTQMKQLLVLMNAYADGVDSLAEGMKELVKGSEELRKGIGKLGDEGIDKLSDMTGEDLQRIVKELRRMKKAGKNYKSFAGLKEGQDGSVSFLIETEEIG